MRLLLLLTGLMWMGCDISNKDLYVELETQRKEIISLRFELGLAECHNSYTVCLVKQQDNKVCSENHIACLEQNYSRK